MMKKIGNNCQSFLMIDFESQILNFITNSLELKTQNVI